MSNSRSGLLIVISSPSGGGKTTVRRRLLEALPDLYYSVSCTTRKPRSGEVDGRDYDFISPEEFKKKKEKGEFFEFAEVYGSFYGTPIKNVKEALEKGQDVLLDIDTQGALQVKAKGEPILIFILPPSLEILKGRLYNRKTDSESEIWNRLKEARKELKSIHHYHYAVVNDKLDATVGKIKAIIDAERQCVHRQKALLEMYEQSVVEELNSEKG